MRELKNKEEDALERFKRREQRLKEMGPARFPTVEAKPKTKQVEMTVRIFNPAYAKHLPQPKYCTLCRSELDFKFIEAKTATGQEIALWHCGSCHNNFGILIGMYVEKTPAVAPMDDQPSIQKRFAGRKVG